MDYTSWQFQKGLKWQWKTLDECYGETFDRENPTLLKYLEIEASEKDLYNVRACWNSWIVPHNVEGYYLNMGDMLVKSGDWQKAIEIYNLAKQVPEFNTWEYKNILEKRIINAQINVEKFRTEIDRSKKYSVDDILLINSAISCMSCHKMSQEDQIIYKDFDWEKYTNELEVYGIKTN